jgi:hypothetical protein
MRGHDAALQASFYADPVNYLDHPDVSHDALIGTLSQAISSRSGLWTFKIDRFATEEQNPDYLRLRLTKHFVQLGDAPDISEKLIRSRMELKRVGGEWKITVEHDFPQGAAT